MRPGTTALRLGREQRRVTCDVLGKGIDRSAERAVL